MRNCISCRYFLMVIVFISLAHIFSPCIFSQVRKTGTEKSGDFYIVTTTITGRGSSGMRIQYYYKGKQYTLDRWASNFYDIVKDCPVAASEVHKYRKKIVYGTILGFTGVGFAIPPSIQFLNGRKVNYVFAGIAFVSLITGGIIFNSRDKNIYRAADYFKQCLKQAYTPSLLNNEYRNYEIQTPLLLSYNFKF